MIPGVEQDNLQDPYPILVPGMLSAEWLSDLVQGIYGKYPTHFTHKPERISLKAVPQSSHFQNEM